MPEIKGPYCGRCVALMTLDGLRQTQTAEGFFHSTLADVRAELGSGIPCMVADTVPHSAIRSWGGTERVMVTTETRDDFSPTEDLGALVLGLQAASLGSYGLKPFDVLRCYTENEQMRDQRKGGVHSYATRLWPVTSRGDPASIFVARRPLLSDPTHPATVSWIKKWLETCRTTHQEPSCQASVPKLPRRVLDLGSDGQPSDMVKLYFSQPGERADYACLSYCWGKPGEQAFMTTSATVESFHTDGVSIRHLSQTIRDAIVQVRLLGLRFLWVDALCIIQDLDADKMEDIQAMGSIYNSSTLTIAIASAQGASDGFLGKAAAGLLHHLPLPFYAFTIPLPDGTSGHIGVFEENAALVHEDVLDSRGWAFQESLLSRRVLRVSDMGITLDCSISRGVTQTSVAAGIRPVYRRLFSGDSQTTPPDLTELITSFTARKLSYPDDRLDAFAGIASEVGSITNSPYVFGVWEKHALPLLSWYLDSGKRAPPSEKSSRAPSWSWASVDGFVSFQLLSGICPVLSRHAVTFEDDGRVVRLRARVGPVCDRIAAGGGVVVEMDTTADVLQIPEVNHLILDAPDVFPSMVLGLLLKPVSEIHFERIGIVRHWDRSVLEDELLTEQDVYLV